MLWLKRIISLGAGLSLLRYAAHLDTENILTAFNLVIHEAGHTLFIWAPEFVYIAAGSIFQIALPAIFVWYFWQKEEWWSASIMMFLVAANILGVSRYAADAVQMSLPLLGGDTSIHDWNYLLASVHLLPYTQMIANTIFSLGIASILGAIIAGMVYADPRERRNLFTL